MKLLIQNKQCQCFPQMLARQGDSIETTAYRMITIHSVLTVLANRKTTLKVLSNILINPDRFKASK